MAEDSQPQAPAQEVAQAPEGYVPQETVNKVVGERAKEARERAISDLLSKTGAESVDDIVTAYSEYQGIQEATQSEADKANERAERFESRAKQAEERYSNTLREYALRDAFRDSGINSERLPLALKVADLSSLELDGDGNVSGIESVVEQVKEASPEWFADSQDRPTRRSPEATRQQTPQEPTYEGQMGGFLSSVLNGR